MTNSEYQLSIFDNAFMQIKVDEYLSRINIPQLPKPIRFKRKMQLFGYQEFWVREAFAALDTIVYDKYGATSKIKGFGNTDGCGLGKTIQTLELAIRIWEEKPNTNHPILILCPKNCKRQWAQKIRQYVSDYNSNIKIYNNPSVLSVMSDDDNTDRHFIVLMHYEALRGEIETFVEENYMFSTVLIDESHRIRNASTGIYKAIKQLQTRYFITATATPWHRNPAELWTTLNLHAPALFPSYRSFEYEHTLYRWQSAVGVKNHKRFANAISRVIIGRTKAELGVEKPIRDVVEIEMSASQLNVYEKIRAGANIVQYLDDGGEDRLKIKNLLSEIIRRQQVTSHPPIIGFKDAESAKMQWIKEFFTDHSEDEEVQRDDNGNITDQEQYLVFFRFKASCQEAVNMLRAMGERVAHLASGTSAADNFDAENEDSINNSADNNSAKDDFEFGRARILCSVIESGGTGLDFRNMPHVTTIFYDIHWSTIKMTQAIDRSHGITSPETRHIMFLIVPDSVDELIYKAMTHNWTEQKLVQEFLSEFNKY